MMLQQWFIKQRWRFFLRWYDKLQRLNECILNENDETEKEITFLVILEVISSVFFKFGN